MSSLEREIEETRQRLATTIDQLLYRAHPKTIVSREVSSIKAHFVDVETGPAAHRQHPQGGRRRGRRGRALRRASARSSADRCHAMTDPSIELTTRPPSRCCTTGSWSRWTGSRASAVPPAASSSPPPRPWAPDAWPGRKVVAVGPHARAVEVGDRVLFDPEDKAEVEVHGEVYVVMRERDVHAVAADRLGDEATGLYL